MKLFLFFILLFSLVCHAQVEELFTLSWGQSREQLGLEVLPMGGPSHEKGYFELRFGPESIAVWKDKEIYILDRRQNRVAAFDMTGKFLRSYKAPTSVLGLAVSEEGNLVAYSPAEKWVVGIQGKFEGQTMNAPDYFGALSEVWFVNEEIWGRCGESVARIDIPQDREVVQFASASCQVPNAISVGIFPNRNQVSIPVQGPVMNAYSSGMILGTDKMAVTLVRPATEEGAKHEIMICDTQGNVSEQVELAPCWTQAFRPYTVTSTGAIYEMEISRTGVTVRRWSSPKLGKVSSRFVPALVRNDYKIPASTGERATVNVWFRSSNVVKTMDLDTYLKGVVSQEIYSSWHIEAHKSMAVGARTYAMARYRHPDKNAHVCDTTCCQAWTANHTSKAIEGVNATSGEYVKRSGSRVTEPLYFSHCNGRTRNSENYDSWNTVAYLRSVSCGCGWTSYYGHGVGMCQYGMQAYALKGWNYRAIIQHYYTGCAVGN